MESKSSIAFLLEYVTLESIVLEYVLPQVEHHFAHKSFCRDDSILFICIVCLLVWLAEEEHTEEVVRITKAFSDFLRISLSRGHEWITISQELEHIKNYLTIQKIRYADILNYSIDADEALMDVKMIKLVLQPLIENAIYHGIKNKRGRGKLKVSAHFTNDSRTFVCFTVEDNGALLKKDLARCEMN